MTNIVGCLADKWRSYWRAHQDGKYNERTYCELTNFHQSHNSQLENNDIMSNLYVNLTSEHITNQSKINLKRERQ